MSIDEKAKELDEIRRIRVLKPETIDFVKYLKSTDLSQKVKPVCDWLDEIREDIANPVPDVSKVMPWSKTESGFQFRPGEVTVYAGSNGSGKSMITGQIALGLIKQGEKVCIASFEMKPKRTLHRMLRQFSGINLELPVFSGKLPISAAMDRFEAFAGDRLWMYDQQGTVTAQQVIAVARYCAVELGVTQFFIDSLMKCIPAEDDYNAQKYFVDELTALARDHNIHIHLIHHIRKLASDELQPNKNDIKGSGSIADQVDNVFLVWRNKKKEHQEQRDGTVDPAVADAMLMCEKQRNGESEDWYSLHFNKASQQFRESFDSVSMAFDDKGEF